MAKSGYRSRESYISKDPAKRANSLANLKRGKQPGKPIEVASDGGVRPLNQYEGQPIEFIQHHFYVIEERKRMELMPFQLDILNDLFKTEPRPNMALIGQPKKTGKSTLAAAIALYYLITKPFAEVYLLASDIDQTQFVCFDKLIKSIRMNPQLRNKCKIKGKSIEYQDSVVRIVAPNTSVAGINPSLIIAEELWDWTTVEQRRAWDELTNIPTREDNLNYCTSYAGFSDNEDSVLWDLYNAGMKQAEGRMEKDERYLFRWYGEELYEQVPYVKKTYLPQQYKRDLSGGKNKYRRLHRNEWVSSEEAFITVEELDVCTHSGHRRGQAFEDEVIIGLDVGYRHDCTALAALGRIDDNTLALIDHAIFTPPPGGTLDLEKTFEDLLTVWAKQYKIAECRFDPYQAIRSAAEMRKKSITMTEYPQTPANLVQMATNLQGLFKVGGIMLYEDRDVRQNLLNASTKDAGRGARIIKRKKSRKIDLVIAIAMAAQGCTERMIQPIARADFLTTADDAGGYWDDEQQKWIQPEPYIETHGWQSVAEIAW